MYSVGLSRARIKTNLAAVSLAPSVYRRAFAVMERLAAAWKPPYEATTTWSAVPYQDGRYEGPGFREGALRERPDRCIAIELGSAQGRFELLCLAVLTGAKVQPDVALKTFLRLRQSGLLRFEDLLSRPSQREAEILALLEKDYRALAVKAQKAAAFVRNARVLSERYGGDLLAVHEPGADADPEEAGRITVEKLQFLSHISSRAYWICREMRRYGLWPNIAPRTGHALDFSVRLSMWRLGLAGQYSDAANDVRPAEYQEVAKALPDLLPFFYQGECRCKSAEGGRCHEGCPVSDFCHLPRRQARAPEDYQKSEALVSGID